MPAQNKAEARRKNIYIYLARQVGHLSRRKDFHLCKRIVEYCVYGKNNASVIDVITFGARS